MDNVVDAIAVGAGPSDISQEIKDALYSKASERIDTYRNVVADRLFGGQEVETGEEEVEAGEEEWSKSFFPKWTVRPLVMKRPILSIQLV